MYTLKSIAKRGATLSAAFVLVVSSLAASAAPAFADALNPLTERSLTLSSSSPGWSNTDGSGNATYAPPNSGANGKQTGNTFQFTTSSNSASNAIKAMTFQYCTASAGQCRAPGDDTTHGADTSSTADLKVVFPSQDEVDNGDFGTVIDTNPAHTDTYGSVIAVPGASNPNDPSDVTGQYAAKNVAGNFVVLYETAGTWQQSTGWTLTAGHQEEAPANPGNYMLDPTGQDNYITLTKAAGEATPAGTKYKVIFFGTTSNYIQNPGSGAFFVKINTYNSDTSVTAANVIDGGVTVANVMNQSIQITTKVLETMQFSVGTVDPNTLDSTDGDATPGSEAPSSYEKAMGVGTDGTTQHTPCDPIAMSLDKSDTVNHPANVLRLGNQTAESSLEVAHTYSTHSYWRLSSNSSAGATVYYSGHTLSNTVGDEIAPIGATKAPPQRGAEQFGLAIDASATAPYTTSYAQEATYENAEDNGLTAIHASTTAQVGSNASWHAPQLAPLVPAGNYDQGAGAIDGSTAANFAFDPVSDTIPVALATESSQVVDCVTAKMRYIANIAATTPAGIYTTKINYIAAPQY